MWEMISLLPEFQISLLNPPGDLPQWGTFVPEQPIFIKIRHELSLIIWKLIAVLHKFKFTSHSPFLGRGKIYNFDLEGQPPRSPPHLPRIAHWHYCHLGRWMGLEIIDRFKWNLKHGDWWFIMWELITIVHGVYQPGKPGIPGKPMEFESTHGKPGKPMEFDNYTWNFMIELFLKSKLCEKVLINT